MQYFLELWLERGILKALWINIVRLVSFSWAFFLFSSRTESYHFAGAISVGKTERVGVDHGSMIDAGSFLIMYSTYAQVSVDRTSVSGTNARSHACRVL